MKWEQKQSKKSRKKSHLNANTIGVMQKYIILSAQTRKKIVIK